MRHSPTAHLKHKFEPSEMVKLEGVELMVLHDGGAVAAITLHRITLFSGLHEYLGPVGQGSLQPYGAVMWATEWPITLKEEKHTSLSADILLSA
jgi:hypothetical protein